MIALESVATDLAQESEGERSIWPNSPFLRYDTLRRKVNLLSLKEMLGSFAVKIC